MLKIGEFSKLSRVSIRMLRYYDETGLLTPAETDSFTSYRYYREDQLALAGKIAALRDMGFSLAAIRDIIANGLGRDEMARQLACREAELNEQASEIQRRLRLLRAAIDHLGKDDNIMKYNVTLKELPERYVASVRQTIPNYEQEGLLWQILMSETAGLNMRDGDPCYTTAIFHDTEYRESDVDVEVQKSVRGTYPNTGHVVFKTEPPVLIASATCKGSYYQMNAVNEAVATWINDNGYAMCGPMFNIYHISPHETDNPDEFVTEVCYPVKKQ